MNILKKLATLFNNQKSETQASNSDSITLTISSHLKDFLENEVIVDLNITKEHFWSSFEKIVNEFSPRNKALLEKREDIQSQIDSWHIDHKDEDFNSR